MSAWLSKIVAVLALSSVLVYGQDHIPVTGLNTAIANNGERPARININHMQALGGPQWDLYILGLQAVQQLDQDDPESYFQIAGIHGRPHIPWNGVESAPGRQDNGYCYHNEVPFITWHRPYVALYEQVIGRKVQDIALRYRGDDAASYRSAAATFRVPYWDWATDANLPPATASVNITVTTPDGEDTIPNPLHSFKWPNFPLKHDPEWFPTDDNVTFWNCTGTQRLLNGDSGNGTTALSLGGLQDKVYAVLSKVKDFDLMATSKYDGPSLEDPHNDVHGATGTFMESAVYSSFDPLLQVITMIPDNVPASPLLTHYSAFSFLHHANVDRLFALWQAINYNTTYQKDPSSISWGTFTQAPGTNMTADDPLAPFYQEDGETFHTSKSVAPIKSFGYTYPEINDWSLSPERTRQLVIRQVNQLYGPNQGGWQQTPKKGKKSLARHAPRSTGTPPETEKQYYVQIGVERSELELPCTIQVMLGSAVVAGSMTIMAVPPSGRTNSEIQLNRGLKRLIPCVEDKTVVPLLEQKLRVEVRRSDGTLIPTESIPSLTAHVESVDVQLAESDDELPNYSTPTSYPRIGRPTNGYPSSGERRSRPGLVRKGIMSAFARLR